MKDEQLLQRIVFNSDVLAGKPVVQGTRLSVQFILNLLAHGETVDTIVAEYTYLTNDDIRACLLFANRVMEDNLFVPLAKVA